MTDVTIAAPSWAMTRTVFPAGVFAKDAVTRWKYEVMSGRVKMFPQPAGEGSTVRVSAEAMDYGPQEIVVNLARPPPTTKTSTVSPATG